MPHTITITIAAGSIQQVEGVPPGCVVEIREYDVVLLRVTDVYGQPYLVSSHDWQQGKELTPLRCHNGRKVSDLPRGFRPAAVMIHRDNVKKVEPAK